MSTIRVGDPYGMSICAGPTPATGFRFYTDDNAWLGKRVKVVRGDCEVSRPVCLGQEGVITGWHDFVDDPFAQFPAILPASCYHMAIISGDNGETFYANTLWCAAFPSLS